MKNSQKNFAPEIAVPLLGVGGITGGCCEGEDSTCCGGDEGCC